MHSEENQRVVATFHVGSGAMFELLSDCKVKVLGNGPIGPSIQTFPGSILNYELVCSILRDATAALYVIQRPFQKDSGAKSQTSVTHDGAENVASAMTAMGVKRIVVLAPWAARTPFELGKESANQKARRRIETPFNEECLNYAEDELAIFCNSKLSWTVIRMPNLKGTDNRMTKLEESMPAPSISIQYGVLQLATIIKELFWPKYVGRAVYLAPDNNRQLLDGSFAWQTPIKKPPWG